MGIIIGDVHKFISNCLIPLDPCILTRLVSLLIMVSVKNKSINIDVYYITDIYLDTSVVDLFNLLANCFLLFYSVLAVFVNIPDAIG